MLSPAYTVVVEAYYDDNSLNAVNITQDKHTYIVNPDLYNVIENPELVIKEIYKARDDIFSELLTNGETVVGYNIQARYDKDGFEDVWLQIGSREETGYLVTSSLSGLSGNARIMAQAYGRDDDTRVCIGRPGSKG